MVEREQEQPAELPDPKDAASESVPSGEPKGGKGITASQAL